MDARTGKVLMQKDADLKLPPASTTKVLTAVVALESSKKPKELLTVSRAATRVPASKLYLRPGQSVSIEDLLYGVLLSSANDGSLVLAEGIAGSVTKFADLMTRKAHALGATNSQFRNPHGLTAPDHYSTARDLAVIFRYAMRNPAFRQIVHTKISSVRSLSPGKKAKPRLISVRNHNRLLWSFEGALGGKTGYTFAAQKCFVGAVERNGVTLIVSLLGSRDLWGDTRRLLEYGFDSYDALNGVPGTTRPGTLQRASVPAVKAAGVPGVKAESDAEHAIDGYILQIGAFRDKQRADSLVRSFSEKGYNAFMEKAALNDTGETAYRVRLGPYAELSQAQEIVREVLLQSGLQAMVIPFEMEPRVQGDAGPVEPRL